MCGEKPEIIFDKKHKVSWKSFWEKYGITPKTLKIGKEIEKEEVVALFGPRSRNGYKFCHNEDEALIVRVKTLWMIMHQRTQMPKTRMINRVEASEIAYEIKIGKKVNWCVLVEWTIHNQPHRLQSFEAILNGKLGHVVDLDSFVDSNREEEEEGLMPTNNMLKAPSKQQVHALRET